jgi:uncharacterized membrane protein
MVGLGDLPGGDFSSQARATSADGSVIVGVGFTGFRTDLHPEAPFIWDTVNGMRNLREVLLSGGVDLTGMTLLQAVGISADGKSILVFGKDAKGVAEGCLVRLGARN